MFYKRRELRRIWEVEIYKGDPEDPNVTTEKVTIIAWNQVDAIRSAGAPVVKQPTALHYVTWAGTGDNVYRINNTRDGPVGDPIVPSIARAEPDTEDWK